VALRTRLAIALAFLLLVVGAASAWSLNRLDDVRAAGREVVQQSQPAMTATNELSRAVLDLQIETAIYVLQPNADQLAAVEASRKSAKDSIAELQSLALNDAATSAAVDAADKALDAWLKDVIDPIVAAIDDGDRERARAISGSDEARERNAALETALADLQDAVVDWRARSVTATSDALTLLERALVVSLLGVLLTVLALWWGLRQWVTLPLASFGRDLRQVAGGDLEHRIPSSGPPDVADAMRDAEDMRQRLLREVDDAIAAREALNHRGPVVAALRRELRASAGADVPGLEASGLLVPAEGVLAGDWYDLLDLPDGRLGAICVDISGHGPVAGLAALRLKYAMDAALRSGAGPRAAVEAAALVMDGEAERFAAAVVVTIAPTGELAWCSAGHPTPMIVSSGGEVERLDPTGPLVTGLGGTWTIGRGTLPVGGTLVVMSDGILESRDADGVELSEVWGDADVARIVNDAASPRDAAEQLAAAARARAARWRTDDVTVLAIRRP
jgi:serine phosphatase RsbU (regulator of sigma subunit)/CHASE3 domain sensor protein